VNGLPLSLLLKNGCKLEHLRLDSQLDATAKVQGLGFRI
jgi:hypothetical protein